MLPELFIGMMSLLKERLSGPDRQGFIMMGAENV